MSSFFIFSLRRMLNFTFTTIRNVWVVAIHGRPTLPWSTGLETPFQGFPSARTSYRAFVVRQRRSTGTPSPLWSKCDTIRYVYSTSAYMVFGHSRIPSSRDHCWCYYGIGYRRACPLRLGMSCVYDCLTMFLSLVRGSHCPRIPILCVSVSVPLSTIGIMKHVL